MILYLDTSALVKLFVAESGSEFVRRTVAAAEFRGCHIVGYAEGCAALARLSRELRLDQPEIEALIAEFELTWNDLDVIMAEWPLVRRAGRLAVQFALRGYDSVHLAAAEAVWQRVGGAAEFRFALFDERLVRAATELSIPILGSSA